MFDIVSMTHDSLSYLFFTTLYLPSGEY